MKKTLLSLLLLNAISTAHSQTFEYTNTQSGNGLIPLGFDVPIPVDSLTPVDGFRTYDSLALRHSQLAAQYDFITRTQVGDTYRGLPIWAYAMSDADNLTVSGAVEASALINGGIHAREWQSPEALTGYIESYADLHDNDYLVSYLIENLNLVVIPVLNIDGFQQTQRFPTNVTQSAESPRDGRMRRKNMRDADTSLSSSNDNLRGVDLNRNNAPFWATNSQRSSDNPDSIVHHGSGPASEPETQALQQAAILANEAQLRFYTDTHSFSQIYFTPMTQNLRRNAITERVATAMRAANNYRYEYGPSGAGGGIGSTDEYFATTYQIPSYTLEIEPLRSAAQYGGFGVSHDGFILPNSEVSRMRRETSIAAITGLYTIAEVPMLMAVEVWDANMQNQVVALSWQSQGTTRSLVTDVAGELSANTDYQLKLIFNKPMRWLENGVVSEFANLTDPLDIRVALRGIASANETEFAIDAAQGAWIVDSDFHRYSTDAFLVPFSLPADFDWQDHSLLFFDVDTEDFVGQGLDTNPATIVGWDNGAWTNYEDTAGNNANDAGGIDRSVRLIDDG